jgi:hypothetical protein
MNDARPRLTYSFAQDTRPCRFVLFLIDTDLEKRMDKLSSTFIKPEEIEGVSR